MEQQLFMDAITANESVHDIVRIHLTRKNWCELQRLSARHQKCDEWTVLKRYRAQTCTSYFKYYQRKIIIQTYGLKDGKSTTYLHKQFY